MFFSPVHAVPVDKSNFFKIISCMCVVWVLVRMGRCVYVYTCFALNLPLIFLPQVGCEHALSVCCFAGRSSTSLTWA